MNVLVIGGAGYVGSHQVKMLCDVGENVIVLDNLNTGFECAVDLRAKFYLGDIKNQELVEAILRTEKIDVVIHFAALSLVGESVRKPLEYYDNNVYGMQVLLQAMQNTQVDKLVFSSSAAVYGEHEVMPITEEYNTNPSSPYGQTKLIMEKMIKDQSIASSIKFISLRYFNVAGASLDSSIGESHDPETHLIPLVIKAAMNDTRLKVFGDDYDTLDGTCIRDYIHVEDLCHAHVLAMRHLLQGKESNIFNLGYGNGFSVLEIIEAVKRVTNLDVRYDVEPRRAGDPAKLVASNKKIKNVLEFSYQYDDIDLIVKSAYDFYQKYPNGYEVK